MKALYDYEGEKGQDELSFSEGDKIGVLAIDISGWWEGEINKNGRILRGQFPSNFTEPINI